MPNWTIEQDMAIKKSGQNIIVSAGAGSGKTAVLTERVMNKVANGININELLILTFTNAAAKEMKDRIRKSLRDKNMKKQLDLLDGAFITTFDSFALSIVKKYHYLLNISSDISIVDSTIINLERERILDSIFEEMYESNNTLFYRLITDLCIKDDIEIKKYILNIDEKLNLKIDKKEYIDTLTDVYFTDDFINKKIEEYINLINKKIEELKNTLKEISYIADGNYYYKLEDSLKNLIKSNGYENIKHSLDIKLPMLPRNSDEELKKLKEKLSELLKNIQELCVYDNVNVIKDSINMTFDYVTIVCEILRKLDNEINLYKFQNELFDFIDIEKMSINILKNNEDVKHDVKKSFKEIMVDEYQDTSDLQELFINLIQDDNVYMVGDIKQSIYRFRNANPNIFKIKYDKYSNHNGGIKIDLNKNFRSRSEVLENINIIFNSVMDDNIGGAAYLKSHQMVFGNQVYENEKPQQNYDMKILNYDYDKENKFTKEEIEYFIICKDIIKRVKNGYLIYDKDIKNYRKCKYSDFSILIDRSTSFSLAKKIFEYHHLPLSIYLDESITKNYDLLIIRNIVKLILKEKNEEYDNTYKYLFMSIARSFLFCYDDNKIFDIITNDKIRNDEIITKIKRLIDSIDSMAISEILFNILKEFKFYEKITKVGNTLDSLVRFEYLYNICNSLEAIGYDIMDFEKYLSDVIDKEYDIKLSANKDDSNSVKIMTIHKSKGLEFPICYFIGLDKAFNLSEIKDRFILSDNYGIIAPYFQNGIGKTIYVDLLKNDYLVEEISEKIRLFYVALTRAKEQIIFILPSNDKKTNTEFNLNCRKNYRSFADIIYSLTNNLDKYIEKLNLETIKLSKDYNKLNKGKVLLNKVDTKIEFRKHIGNDHLEKKKFSKTINTIIDSKNYNNLELGLLFHENLEYINFTKPDFDNINNEFIKNKIKVFLNNKIFENMASANIYKEVEFMYENEDIEYHGIIDLLLEYGEYIDIIDYKLKYIFDENYKKQLLGYKKYINSISNKNINIYLYSILDEKMEKLDI